MEKTWIVYQHISPSNKVYVGVTSREVEIRWKNGYKSNSYFINAINKYGWNNIEHRIVAHDLSEIQAKSLEIVLIRYFKNKNISYNITDGGDGMLGVKLSEETKEKISKSKIGIPSKRRGTQLSQETKRKISLKKIGKYCGENNPNYGNDKLKGEKHFMYGKKHTEETKNKIRISSYGRTHKMPIWLVDKLVNINSIPIEQYSLNDEFIREFKSSIEAAKYFGKGESAASHIRECCKNKRNKTLNYKWRYKNG